MQSMSSAGKVAACKLKPCRSKGESASRLANSSTARGWRRANASAPRLGRGIPASTISDYTPPCPSHQPAASLSRCFAASPHKGPTRRNCCTALEPRISRADAALSTEITLGVLRWQRLLDFLLGRNLDRLAERLDPEVLIALRLGLYQLRFLERIPAHAAVDESVELVKHARKYSAAGLVNAVLRRASPEAKVSGKALLALLPAEASFAERCGISALPSDLACRAMDGPVRKGSLPDAARSQ